MSRRQNYLHDLFGLLIWGVPYQSPSFGLFPGYSNLDAFLGFLRDDYRPDHVVQAES